MSRIVLGVGTSHTPMLALRSEQWEHRANADRENSCLNVSDGRDLTYEQLLAEVEGRYEEVISREKLGIKEAQCEVALDQLANEIEAAAPDVVVIIGDDQAELFRPANQPAIAIFHGEELRTYPGKYGASSAPDWMKQVGYEYLMDTSHRWPGHPPLSRHLIENLINRNVDVAAIAEVEDPKRAGFGHAYGFVIKRLFKGRRIPVVPVLLNTYFPPNVPSAARCYDIGLSMRAVIETAPFDLRVAVVASGGLSHFVVDEDLDRAMLQAMAKGDIAKLRSVPRATLRSGTSEILNWIMTAGVVSAMRLQWYEYQPLIRTPAGTGTGAGFCVWRD